MASGDTHFEVFVRRTPAMPWKLDSATEDRTRAMETAETLLKEGRVAAVRVTKEVRDAESGEYRSYTLLTKGEVATEKAKPVRTASAEPNCVSAADFYKPHARATIGRLLAEWLRRRKVTAFELLHRPDLAESLEASGVELQHAIQKICVPESQANGAPIHDLIRAYQKLADDALARVMQAGRKGLFADLKRETLGELAGRLAGTPERQFLLGGAVARQLADAPDWPTKIDRLLGLAESLPEDPALRTPCRAVLEGLLAEILAQKSGVGDLVGAELDLGRGLLALARLVAPTEVERLMAVDAGLRAEVPELNGAAARLSVLMAGDEFSQLRTVIGRRVLEELKSPRRLRPTDPDGEIAVLRALAMALTAAAGRVLTADEVQAAFLDRSGALVTADFVTGLTRDRPTVLEEIQALVRLAENVTGTMNRNRAAEWLISNLDSLRFEKECRTGGVDTVISRLAALAALDRSMRRIRLRECDERQLCERLGALGGMVEADARFCALLTRSPMTLAQKTNLLLRLAGGDLRLAGPTTERARGELARLFAAPEARSQLAAMPEVMERMRALMAA